MRLGSVAAPLPAGATGVFTTRSGGVSAGPYASSNLGLHVDDRTSRVLANRAALDEQMGGTVRFAHQVHGADVLVVDAQTPAGPLSGRGGAAGTGVDALLTAVPGVPVAALVADCMPVLLADVEAGVAAAAHAGRAGLVAGVLQATVAAMRELGAVPERTVAVVGPAAGRCCYEVPEPMREAVERDVPGTAATTRRGTPSLDLAAGAWGVLRAQGVGHVHLSGICTIDDTRFYSHRRQRPTGRFAGVVVLDRS